jgi:hypothetical protein
MDLAKRIAIEDRVSFLMAYGYAGEVLIEVAAL